VIEPARAKRLLIGTHRRRSAGCQFINLSPEIRNSVQLHHGSGARAWLRATTDPAAGTDDATRSAPASTRSCSIWDRRWCRSLPGLLFLAGHGRARMAALARRADRYHVATGRYLTFRYRMSPKSP
jgi:hypothetical protein